MSEVLRKLIDTRRALDSAIDSALDEALGEKTDEPKIAGPEREFVDPGQADCPHPEIRMTPLIDGRTMVNCLKNTCGALWMEPPTTDAPTEGDHR